MDVGRPPGKGRSIGDAINWEALLKAVPKSEDLHLVTGDSDFVSPVDTERISQYLADEWLETKGSNVYLYPNLSTFFGQHFPEIKIQTELEKELAIQSLGSSFSFKETHVAIAALNRWKQFSAVEREAILREAMANDQVWGIILDSDVSEFLERIVRGHESELPAELVADYEGRRAQFLKYRESWAPRAAGRAN